MKVEPVAWRVDSSKTHHFTLYDAKQVPLWESRAGSDKDVKITPMYPAIPPGYALVRVEQVKDAERLDFLDGNLKFSMGWQVNKAPVGNVGVHSIIFAGRLPVTIREAIDKAMLTAAAKGE